MAGDTPRAMAADPTTGGAVPLAHSITGHGPLAVLLHGITEDHRTFDPLVPALAEDHTVLTVDLRGHGASPAAARYGLDEVAADVASVVSAVRDAAGTETSGGAAGPGDGNPAPLVIGHSLGGLIAAVYGARYPVRGVINIDQSLDLAPMQTQIHAVEAMLRGDGFQPFMAGMFAQMMGALPQSEQDRIGAIRRPVQQVVLGIWAPLLDGTVADLVDAVDEAVSPATPYPYLQIDGTPSGPGYPNWLARRIPGAVVDDWGPLGHYPHLCEPERFVAAVRDFDPAV